jgi:hypothetical protein
VRGRVLVEAMFEFSSSLIGVNGVDLVGDSDLFLFPSSFHCYYLPLILLLFEVRNGYQY